MDIEKIIIDRISELLLKEAPDSSSPEDKKDDPAKPRRPRGPAPKSVKDFIRRAESEPEALLKELRAINPGNKDKIIGSVKILDSIIKNYSDVSKVFSGVYDSGSSIKLKLQLLIDGHPAVSANYSSRYAAAIVYAAAKLKWIDADPDEVEPRWTGKDSKEVFVNFS